MATLWQTWWRALSQARAAGESRLTPSTSAPRSLSVQAPPVDIATDDPILAYFEATTSATDVVALHLDSPALTALQAAGVRLVVPLVSQGELVGLLNLGPRAGDVDYSRDDKRLLENLAAQAAPAVRLAQLVRRQEAEVRARASMDQELRLARVIQQYFLPKSPPDLPGWKLAAHYRPARAVGGDFYDFIPLGEGKLGIVIGDVADKGVPAALVMAATRSLLRASAQRLVDPAEVLARVNDLVVSDTPPHIFVTCLYAVLDLANGGLRYANAGHDPAFVRTNSGDVSALQARGLPLGVMSDYVYASHEAQLSPLDTALFYSDGLVEAHNGQRQMFSFERLKHLMARHSSGTAELVDMLLAELDGFVGSAWEQEDDVTLVAVQRTYSKVLTEFSIERDMGDERVALTRVVDAIRHLGLPAERLDQLKTATAEAVINAIEHSSAAPREEPVVVRVLQLPERVTVRISNPIDLAVGLAEAAEPDLLAKLEGREQPRGWGGFLMKRLTDDLKVTSDNGVYTVELSMDLPSC